MTTGRWKPRVRYKAYVPRPFTRSERSHVSILFGGLHWRVERVVEAVFENAGYRAQRLPTATRAGPEPRARARRHRSVLSHQLHHRQPRVLPRRRAAEIGADEVAKRYVYLTAGACGACRFGQYHQSYELALRNIGLEAFRLFLMAQDSLDQGGGRGDGLEIDLFVSTGIVWAILCTDVLQDLDTRRGRTRSSRGKTDAVVAECVELLCDAFRDASALRPPLDRAGLAPVHVVLRAGARRDRPEVRGHRGRPAEAETDRQDHRRVLPADRGRRSQLQHPPVARSGRGARSTRRRLPSGSTTGCAGTCRVSRITSAWIGMPAQRLPPSADCSGSCAGRYDRLRGARLAASRDDAGPVRAPAARRAVLPQPALGR